MPCQSHFQLLDAFASENITCLSAVLMSHFDGYEECEDPEDGRKASGLVNSKLVEFPLGTPSLVCTPPCSTLMFNVASNGVSVPDSECQPNQQIV